MDWDDTDVTSRQAPPGKRGRTPGKKVDTAKPRLESDVRSTIGAQLRAMYNDVLTQGVPDRFSELLQKLDAASDKEEPESNGT
jgi:hypothetical protein